MNNADSENNWTQNLFNIAPVGLALVRNRVLKEVNQRFCELLGYSRDELIGQNTSICYADEQEYKLAGQQIYEQINKTGQANLEARAKCKDGTIIDVLISTSIFDKTDKDSEFAFAVIDITDRKKAKEQLRDEKEFAESAINAQIDTLFIFDPSNGKPIRWNNAFSRLSGYSNEEIASMKAPDDWYDKKDLEKVTDLLDTISRDGQITVEMSLQTKNGQRILTEYRASYIMDAEGNPKYVIAIGRDITQRRQTEKKLIREQYFSESIIQTSPAYFVAIDADGKTKVMNQTMLKALGYSSEEAIGKDYVKTFIPERERHNLHEVFAKLIHVNKPTVNENSILTKDGRELLAEWHGQPVYDDNGRFDFFFGVGIDITERKQAEQALQRSEAYLKSLFRAAPTGIGVVANRIMKQVNERMCEMIGYSKEELIGKNARMLYLSDKDFEYVGREKYAQISDHGTGTVETRWLCKDGRIIDVLLSSTPLDINNLSKDITFTALDITDRKRAEEEVRKFKTISDRANYGTAIVDIEGNIIYINECFASMHGLTIDEAIGKHLSIFHTKEQMPDVDSLNKELIKNGSYPATEVWHKRQDGSVFPTMMNATIITDENNRPLYISASAVDITGRKQSEEALNKSRAFTDNLIRTANTMIIGLDAEGNIQLFNQAAEKITGYKKKELGGKNWFETLVPRKKYSQVYEIFSRLQNGKLPRLFENPILTKSGEERIISWSNNELREDNKIIGTISFGIDITERKQAEEALRERERMLDALINAPTESAILIDTKGTILAINRIGAKRLGKNKNEIIGMTIYDFLSPKLARSRKAKGNQVIRTGQPIRFQDERGGRNYDTNIYPVFDERGKVAALVINARDVTRHRRAEIMMRSLVEGTAKATGRDFFDKLVQHLATALNCRHAMIGVLDDTEPKQIRTLSYWNKNKIEENFRFEIAGTPCENVDNRNGWFFQSQVSKIYPNDKWLAKNKIESDLGVPLLNPQGYSIGILAVLDSRKFSDDLIDGAHSLMSIFASRAAAELKRISAEDKQQAIANRLRDEQKALSDKHIALKQILEHMETEKLDFRHQISSSMEQALMPFVKKLHKKEGTMSKKDMELFEDTIKSITGTEIDDFRANYAKLTSREMDICDLIKKGLSSQEIADKLHLSLQTIQKHRSSIRKKLQLKNKEINLPAYLRYK